MIITNVGRPVGRFPIVRWSDGAGGFLLLLERVDVSDVGNTHTAEPFYVPLIRYDNRDKMNTVELRLGSRLIIIFLSTRRINVHVARQIEE